MNSSQTGDANGARNSWVLDASALLAVILGEPGQDTVKEALVSGAVLGTVNLAEIVSRLMDKGRTLEEARSDVQFHEFTLVDFELEDALEAARLRPLTRERGLSLGDRACLAVAQRLGLRALTADRQWAGLDVGVEIVVCR
jgi:ribonuclease VapC